MFRFYTAIKRERVSSLKLNIIMFTSTRRTLIPPFAFVPLGGYCTLIHKDDVVFPSPSPRIGGSNCEYSSIIRYQLAVEHFKHALHTPYIESVGKSEGGKEKPRPSCPAGTLPYFNMAGNFLYGGC